jgi:3-deoxy-D-manno-octulosonic acid kinase
VAGLLDGGNGLHQGAAAEALTRKEGDLHGRGPVHLVEGTGDGERWAVRHFHRGGLLAPLTGDRYLRSWALPRPFAELAAGEVCLQRGVPTPLGVAAAMYGRGPVYRGDLITRYIPGSMTLARFLLPGEGGRGDRRLEALELAGSLVRLLAERGIGHADLNVKNLLLVAGEGGLEGYVLDLDRVRVAPQGRRLSGEPMVRRLARSLAKWERRSGEGLPAGAWEALEGGWGGAVPRP